MHPSKPLCLCLLRLDYNVTDKLHLFGNCPGEIRSRLFDFCWDPGRDHRDVKDVGAMNVFANRERSHGTVGIARDDDRNLLFEIDRALRNQFIPGPVTPDFIKVVWLLDEALSLAVIAEGGAFQNGGSFDVTDRSV